MEEGEGSLGTRPVTDLLLQWAAGRAEVEEELFTCVQEELRRISRALLRGERRDHTLQTTALVNEAYIRLVDVDRIAWQDRAHFLAICAKMMRRILVDHARGRGAMKRGGDWQRVTMTTALDGASSDTDVLALHEALDRLADLDPGLARLVELRYFAGLTVAETAEVVGVSAATIKREWNAARLWLARELDPERDGAD